MVAELAENQLNEELIGGEWQSATVTKGDFGTDYPGYTWELTQTTWSGDSTNSMTELTMQVSFLSRGQTQSVKLTTLANASLLAAQGQAVGHERVQFHNHHYGPGRAENQPMNARSEHIINGPGGFTLLEVLLASVIASIVLIAVYQVFGSAMKARNNAADRSRAIQLRQRATGAIRSDLQNALVSGGILASTLQRQQRLGWRFVVPRILEADHDRREGHEHDWLGATIRDEPDVRRRAASGVLHRARYGGTAATQAHTGARGDARPARHDAERHLPAGNHAGRAVAPGFFLRRGAMADKLAIPRHERNQRGKRSEHHEQQQHVEFRNERQRVEHDTSAGGPG